jgi:hypothetical protein
MDPDAEPTREPAADLLDRMHGHWVAVHRQEEMPITLDT